MRVLVVDSYYGAFVKQLYARTPALAAQSYAVQKRALMETLFGTSDFYSANLEAIGHHGTEVVYSCEPVQVQWAREHGMRTMPAYPSIRGTARLPWVLRFAERERARILAAQVKDYGADVVHFQDPVGTAPQIIEAVRKHTSVVTSQVASHVPRFEALGYYDMVLTSYPHYVSRFRSAGVRSEYFNLGFEPAVLAKLSKGRSHDVVFVGGLSPRHAARTEWLESVATRIPLKWWGYGVEHLSSTSPLRACYKGEAWGIDMYNIFYNSRIVLNHHIDEAENNANNMRLYEATGTGALLLTDSKKNLRDLFEPGTEVATYSSANECVQQIEHFLGNEDDRLALSRAGQRRTLGSHTYRHRMEQFVEIVSPLVGRA